MQPLSPAALAEILPGCTAYFPTCDPHLSPINAHWQGGSGVVRRTRKRARNRVVVFLLLLSFLRWFLGGSDCRIFV
jgi:hypothetical protein